MRFYTFSKWLHRFYPDAIWDFFSSKEKVIYLTFDDGPNPESTEWILKLLEEYNAKATFFCLGKNVISNPGLLEKIKSKEHSTGSHGMNHLNGFQTSNSEYLDDVKEAQKIIKSNLFRAAYGKISRSQFREVKKLGYQIVFWSLLTYDFDATLTSEKRIKLIRKKTKPGSILVFHDSDKAFPQLKNELPVLIKEWSKKGYRFQKIE